MVCWLQMLQGLESKHQEVCDFIDKYVSCGIPSEVEGDLRELVLLLQQHKHSTYCKHNRCHFKFPHPPSNSTLISKPHNSDKVESGIIGGDSTQSLSEVRKELIDGNTGVSLVEL